MINVVTPLLLISVNSKDLVFSFWNGQCRTFACYFPFDFCLAFKFCLAFEFDLVQHQLIQMAHPQADDSDAILCVFVSPEWLLMFIKTVPVFLDAKLLLFKFSVAEAGCLNWTWLSRYCWLFNDLLQYFHFTPYTLTSVCIFSILFPIHFLRCWQRELTLRSKDSLVFYDFPYSDDLSVRFRGDISPSIGKLRWDTLAVDLMQVKVKASNFQWTTDLLEMLVIWESSLQSYRGNRRNCQIGKSLAYKNVIVKIV